MEKYIQWFSQNLKSGMQIKYLRFEFYLTPSSWLSIISSVYDRIDSQKQAN